MMMNNGTHIESIEWFYLPHNTMNNNQLTERERNRRREQKQQRYTHNIQIYSRSITDCDTVRNYKDKHCENIVSAAAAAATTAAAV